MLEYLRLLPNRSGFASSLDFHNLLVGIGVVAAAIFAVYLVVRRR